LLNIAVQLNLVLAPFVHKAALYPVLIQSVGVSTSRSLQFPAVYRYRLAEPAVNLDDPESEDEDDVMNRDHEEFLEVQLMAEEISSQ